MQHKQSEVLFGRAMDVLVEGCSSASRGPMNYKPFPPYIREGQGSRVWDGLSQCVICSTWRHDGQNRMREIAISLQNL